MAIYITIYCSVFKIMQCGVVLFLPNPGNKAITHGDLKGDVNWLHMC